MTTPPPDAPLDRLADIYSRLLELHKQLEERAKLYELLGASEISEEFERLATVEVKPTIVQCAAVLAALQSDDAAWQQAENDLATCQCRLHAAECELAALRVAHPRAPEETNE